MSRALLTPQAERDIDDIGEYIAANNPAEAYQLVRSIRQRCQALAKMPETGRSREELAPGLRISHVGRYLIFFRPDPEGIEVVRVVHGSRDLPKLFE